MDYEDFGVMEWMGVCVASFFFVAIMVFLVMLLARLLEETWGE